MSSPSSDSNEEARSLSPVKGDSILRGVLIGLIPLGLLVGIIVIILVLAALTRQLLAASGFFVQQQTVLLVVIAGLILTVAIYAVAIWLSMRCVAMWRQEGAQVRAISALWTLAITALIVVLPVLVAAVLPQHPAP